MHQGRVIPAEFIGFTKSQTPINMEGEVVTNHNELMSNFFAQPDALAIGKDIQTLKDQGVPELRDRHDMANMMADDGLLAPCRSVPGPWRLHICDGI